MDLYIGGTREDTIKHNPLPGGTQQRVTSNLARPVVCTATAFRIALDTQQLVTERDEANNTQQRTITPPCPDLVIDIDKDSVSNGTTSPTNWFALPVMSQRRVGPLAPNETVSFYEGGDHLGVTRFHYRALVDRFDDVRESNEDNNEKRESMGGGS